MTTNTEATQPVAVTPRPSLVATLRHTRTVTRRNVLRFVRLPQLLLFNTVQPVMFLLLFTFAFGGAIELVPGVAAAGGYINYLIPGILVQQAVFGATGTALGLTEDLDSGIIDRFRSLPMARSAVLTGRTLADLTRNTVVNSIMLVLGIALGWRVAQGFGAAILAVVIALLFGYAISWMMAAIGLAAKTPETAQAAGFLPIFPLVFASSAFMPTATMPGWLQAFANNQPITIIANTVRALTLNDGSREILGMTDVSGLVMQSFLWIGAIVLVFAPIAVRMYRKATSAS